MQCRFKSIIAKRRFVDFWKKIWTLFVTDVGCGVNEEWFNETSSSKIILKSNDLSFRPVHSMFQFECMLSKRTSFRKKSVLYGWCALSAFVEWPYFSPEYFWSQSPHGTQYIAPWRSQGWTRSFPFRSLSPIVRIGLKNDTVDVITALAFPSWLTPKPENWTRRWLTSSTDCNAKLVLKGVLSLQKSFWTLFFYSYCHESGSNAQKKVKLCCISLQIFPEISIQLLAFSLSLKIW